MLEIYPTTSNFTISGNINGFCIKTFPQTQNNTVTFDNVKAESTSSYGFFEQDADEQIYTDGHLTVNLVGENVVTLHNDNKGIYAGVFTGSSGTISLKCTGVSATLTVICKNFSTGGISNFDNVPGLGLTKAYSAGDLESIAADGYKVERSEVKDYPALSGYKTYTYTVTLLP